LVEVEGVLLVVDAGLDSDFVSDFDSDFVSDFDSDLLSEEEELVSGDLASFAPPLPLL